MAATERRRRRARRRGGRALRNVPWLAAGLGALAARDAQGQALIDARFLFYKESGGRTQVLNPVILMHPNLGEEIGTLDLQLGFDSISGASPSGAYPTVDVTTSASGHSSTNGNIPQTRYEDQRKSAALSYGRKFGANLPSVDLSYAKENDYTARTLGVTDSWTLFHGRGTLHAGASFSRDTVAPVTNNLSLPKSENGYSLGWTWILAERDLVDLSGSVMKLSGYLDDPYKIVPVGEPGTTNTLPDHRPDTRTRYGVVAKYGHHFLWDGAVKVSYRYYWDDWSVRAHTLDVTYDHRLSSDWIVTPRVRLYTQTAASFYASLLAAPQTYRSADYRLSPLTSILGGLALAHKLDDEWTVSLGATLQSQQGRDRVAPVGSALAGGAGTVSSADLAVTTVTLGFTWGR